MVGREVIDGNCDGKGEILRRLGYAPTLILTPAITPRLALNLNLTLTPALALVLAVILLHPPLDLLFTPCQSARISSTKRGLAVALRQ